ncbi:MAG: imidazoleglycerol-phosphate dehydratase HisB [Peptococcaceae bacterium]|nr:imidazoleglycerol-phosphate dehydratase HisB [Peptococcaceae bacterium]
MRSVSKERQTKETSISLFLNLDGGEVHIASGIGFFDHMLTALAVHAGWGLVLNCDGDIWVDGHHSVEDIGIVLGQALAEVIDKAGIQRYGCAFIPMDEALCRAVVDVSGRPFLVYHAPVAAPMIGEYDTELTEEFFRALAMNAGITLHIEALYGKNAHHIVEGVYKAVAHALADALAPRDGGVLSTKGVLA